MTPSKDKLDQQIEKLKRWSATGYYSCNCCGWKGDRPYNHNQRCEIKAVRVTASTNSTYEI